MVRPRIILKTAWRTMKRRRSRWKWKRSARLFSSVESKSDESAQAPGSGLEIDFPNLDLVTAQIRMLRRERPGLSLSDHGAPVPAGLSSTVFNPPMIAAMSSARQGCRKK